MAVTKIADQIEFPNEFYVNLPAGTKLKAENSKGESKMLVLRYEARAKLVPAEGESFRFEVISDAK